MMKKELYISVGIDVGADFSEMSIALPRFETDGKSRLKSCTKA